MKKKLSSVAIILFLLTISMISAIIQQCVKSKYNEILKTLSAANYKQISKLTISSHTKKPVIFKADDAITVEFLRAVADFSPYSPAHDSVISWDFIWHLEVILNNELIQIRCYIPASNTNIVVGEMIKGKNFSYGYFKSCQLLHWYQKYGHYWQVGGYQKVQYGRVLSVLKPIAPKDVLAFNIIPGDPESLEKQEIIEFVQNREFVAEFFQALGDMHFAAPTYKESTAQWTVQIRSGTTAINIECSIPAENPTTVIGLVDSHEGYTYFQSQNLFQWYQQYSHRWLEPEHKE